MGLLDSTCRRRTLPGRFGGQLLPGGFTTGGLTGSLFGTCHGTLMKRSKEEQEPMRTAAAGKYACNDVINNKTLSVPPIIKSCIKNLMFKRGPSNTSNTLYANVQLAGAI